MKFHLFIFFALSVSLEAKEILLMRLNEGQKEIAVQKFEGMDVNDLCFKASKKCLEKINEKPKIETKSESVAGNPASLFCEAKGGRSLILEDKKHNEYDYCELSDGFIINSWHMYKKNKK
jgi:putative hemolysin